MATAICAQNLDRLVINKKDGTSITLMLKDQPKIAFEDQYMTITTQPSEPGSEPQAPITLYFDDLDSMTPTAPVMVEDICANGTGITIAVEADAIIFTNIGEQAQPVSISDLSGRTWIDDTAAVTYTLHRSALAPGIYIVKIGSFTAKIKL